MNRTLDQAAAVLGIGPRKLRGKLRDEGVINHAGELACRYRDKGHFYVDTRSRWNPSINTYTHYGVVMVTERGVAFLAALLNIPVTQKNNKEAAA